MGPDPADRIRHDGHVRRTKRPDTWQHPTSLHQRHKISCQQGAVHTWDPTPRIALGPAAMTSTKRPDIWQHPTSCHRRRKTSCNRGRARRARIVLAAAEGLENQKAGHDGEHPTSLHQRRKISMPTGSRRRSCTDPTPRIALGPAAMYAAPKGRTHGSTRPACINVTKSLANREPSTHGTRPRALALSHLAGLRLAAASLGDLQAVERSLLRGEGPRHRRSVFGAAGSCPGSLCRRKEPDPGPGPFPAPLADAPRAGGAAATTTSATARPVRRTKRPDTWQHPTSLHQRHKISCQQGAVHTWLRLLKKSRNIHFEPELANSPKSVFS